MAQSMKVGTKSVLFGAHQFLIHPWFVAAAWAKLYGFPWDPRLWVAFFVHDLGYLGKPNMDGSEGESHVELGANIMRRLFGDEWGDFCLYHSRFYAKRNGTQFSKLCVADKLAVAFTPWWLYIPFARLSGEMAEYKTLHNSKYSFMHLETSSDKQFVLMFQKYLRDWAYKHSDMREDDWTKV